MVEGDGLVQVREIAEMIGLKPDRLNVMRRKGVFYAVKLPTRVYAVRQEDLAEVMDRISRYQAKVPFWPDRNMTIAEACAALRVKPVSVYSMMTTGTLTRARDELWHFPTRESVRRLQTRRGLRVSA